jgi:hypothetical protein
MAEAALKAEPYLHPVSFNCPSCDAPVAVLFDVREISYGHVVQSPVVAFEPITWTTTLKKQAR